MGIATFNRMKKRKAEMGKTTQKPSVDLSKLKVDELKALAKDQGLTGYSDLKKDDLIELISEVI
jgi:hypothetical protein